MTQLTLGDPFLARVVVDHPIHYLPELKKVGSRIELFEGPRKVAVGVLGAGAGLEATPADVDCFIRDPRR